MNIKQDILDTGNYTHLPQEVSTKNKSSAKVVLIYLSDWFTNPFNKIWLGLNQKYI